MPPFSNLRVYVHGAEQQSPPFIFFSLSFSLPPFCSPVSPVELAAHPSLANHTDSTGWVFGVVFSAQNGEVGRRRDA